MCTPEYVEALCINSMYLHGMMYGLQLYATVCSMKASCSLIDAVGQPRLSPPLKKDEEHMKKR